MSDIDIRLECVSQFLAAYVPPEMVEGQANSLPGFISTG